MSLPAAGFSDALCIYRKLRDDPLMEAFFSMLDEASWGTHASLSKSCARFIGLLYERKTTDWSKVLEESVLSCPIAVELFAAGNEAVPDQILEAMNRELSWLEECAMVRTEDVDPGFHASWTTHPLNLREKVFERLLHIHRYGSGDYAKYHMFRVTGTDTEPEIVPIAHPDPISFEQMQDYEDQHNRVIENTRAFLEGRPSNNVLLYGAAGTGKSATVKALGNKFRDEGLRIIEMDRDHLDRLPALLDMVGEVPLRFILFIDDLSFQESDSRYTLLKAILEGSAAAGKDNVRIYATSNRRHLVRESSKEREEDLHAFDHMQELASLSDRFGLQVLYELPDKKQYLNLARGFAREKGLEMDEERLAEEVERFALKKGSRSVRTARQAIDHLLVRQNS